MIGTDYLLIIILWCGQGKHTWESGIDKCRREKIACVSSLKNFTTNDVVHECLLKDGDR